MEHVDFRHLAGTRRNPAGTILTIFAGLSLFDLSNVKLLFGTLQEPIGHLNVPRRPPLVAHWSETTLLRTSIDRPRLRR